jgi:hypothetical protein
MNWTEINKLLTPEGQREFVELITELRNQAGQNWLNELREFSPTLCEVADAVVNYDFETAFPIICQRFPPAKLMQSQLKAIHAKLNAEITRNDFNLKGEF